MSDVKTVRVLLADDHALVRAGVRKVLEGVPGIEVVGEAGRGDETLARLAELEPDLLLLDLNMPGGDGFEVLRAASDMSGSTRILVLTLHVQMEYVARAVREGRRRLSVQGPCGAGVARGDRIGDVRQAMVFGPRPGSTRACRA